MSTSTFVPVTELTPVYALNPVYALPHHETRSQVAIPIRIPALYAYTGGGTPASLAQAIHTVINEMRNGISMCEEIVVCAATYHPPYMRMGRVCVYVSRPDFGFHHAGSRIGPSNPVYGLSTRHGHPGCCSSAWIASPP